MLPDELPALALGHAAPNPELHPVVERVGKALGYDGALSTEQSGSFLGRAGDEKLVGIGGAAQGFGDPCETALTAPHV